VYLWEHEGGQLAYGFPLLDGAVKAAVFHSGDRVENPDLVRRAVRSGEIEAVRQALQHVLPDAAKGALHHSQTCLFTNTPDVRFVIDWHPAHSNVLVSSPCSGHGFKFASAIGELQANLLLGRTPRFDLSPFALARFGSLAGNLQL
jgi:sarcosine oxidase